MTISIDLNCFFDGTLGYDLRSTEEYKKNLNKCQKASEKLILEVKKNLMRLSTLLDSTIKKK